MEGTLSPSKRSKPVLDDTNGIVRLVREQSPEHCILKVNSFDELSSIDATDYIKSKEFKAGGHNWVLYVYPQGNNKECGGGHLSLYVTLIDELELGTSVSVSLRFFIYDQIRDNYLAFVDIRDKCYHTLKTSWGIPKLMPLESFTNASNGFLVNDCCVLGAEVLVRDSQPKRSIVTILTSTPSACDMSYTWNVEKFSVLNDDRCYSPVFCFDKWSWKLLMYPRGNKAGEGKYVSLYLGFVNADKLTGGNNLYAKFCLRIKNREKRADHSKTASKWFSSETQDWGFDTFLAISDVYDTSKGFLLDDTLTVEVEIKKMLSMDDTYAT